MTATTRSPRRGPALPWGLLGTLALVIAGEAGMARQGGDAGDLAAAHYRFADKASRRADRFEILCFGDSLVKYGVVPRALEAVLGRSSYNLAVAGGLPPLPYLLLRRVLESGGRPAAVVVDFKANLVQVDPRCEFRHIAGVARLDECLDLGWVARDPKFAVSLALARVLPSFRYRHEVRLRITLALGGLPPRGGREVERFRRNWAVNRGAQLMPVNPKVEEIAEFWDENAYLDSEWRCHPENRMYIDGFLALAAGRRIPVFWVVPPIHPRVQARREALGLDARYWRFVEEVAAAHPNVVVVDGRGAGFDSSLYVDGAHLDRRGALVLSTALASVIQRHLGGQADSSRQVRLPSRSEVRQAVLDVEDLDQSKAALERLATRTR